MKNGAPNILLTGPTGFVGKRLLYRLDEAGLKARCLVRPPEKLILPKKLSYEPEVVYGDLLEPSSLEKAMEGMDAAYYLVHSMGGRSIRHTERFAEMDRRAASNFARAAKGAGLSRVIYLGGLGDEQDDLSKHLPHDFHGSIDAHP